MAKPTTCVDCGRTADPACPYDEVCVAAVDDTMVRVRERHAAAADVNADDDPRDAGSNSELAREEGDGDADV